MHSEEGLPLVKYLGSSRRWSPKGSRVSEIARRWESWCRHKIYSMHDSIAFNQNTLPTFSPNNVISAFKRVRQGTSNLVDVGWYSTLSSFRNVHISFVRVYGHHDHSICHSRFNSLRLKISRNIAKKTTKKEGSLVTFVNEITFARVHNLLSFRTEFMIGGDLISSPLQ